MTDDVIPVKKLGKLINWSIEGNPSFAFTMIYVLKLLAFDKLSDGDPDCLGAISESSVERHGRSSLPPDLG